ncbi:MAG TPA: hypothetical protein VH414_21020 [Lichenihabitans sp.]|jgi:hypothetical protein|nr:hypothetical protein [Lichenihabitans sp.]
MSEAALLRVLADRLDELDSLKQFPVEVTDPGIVTVGWTAGNDHPGYAVLSQAISAMVEQHWNALRSQVVKKKETEVSEARQSWSSLAVEAEAEAEPAAQENDVPAPGLSVPQQLSRVQLVQRHA